MSRKKQDLMNDWKQNIVRIRFEYNRLCSFLEYVEKKEDTVDIRIIFDKIFLTSLDHLYKNGFHYEMAEFKGRREPKGFLIKENTTTELKDAFEIFKQMYKKLYNKKLLYAEFIELLLYIYCKNYIDKKDFNYLEIDWGIKDIQ